MLQNPIMLITCANDVTLRVEGFGRFGPVAAFREPPVEQTPPSHNHLPHIGLTNIFRKYQDLFGEILLEDKF